MEKNSAVQPIPAAAPEHKQCHLYRYIALENRELRCTMNMSSM